jgi:hypothetical protein
MLNYPEIPDLSNREQLFGNPRDQPLQSSSNSGRWLPCPQPARHAVPPIGHGASSQAHDSGLSDYVAELLEPSAPFLSCRTLAITKPQRSRPWACSLVMAALVNGDVSS